MFFSNGALTVWKESQAGRLSHVVTVHLQKTDRFTLGVFKKQMILPRK